MNIIGLDVGRGYAVAAILSCFPVNIQQHFKQHRKEFIKLKTNADGVAKLLSLEPDGIVLEPSGNWYSKFWAIVAMGKDIDVFWVGHADLAHQRGSYGFVNKRDDEDALCLAATYFDDRFIDERGQKRFLSYYQIEQTDQIRELFLEKEQLAKQRNLLINQIRQRLCFEFPEIAQQAFIVSSLREFTPVVGWLGGLLLNKRYDNLWTKSISNQLGIKISDYTRSHALALATLEKRITHQYQLIEEQLSNPIFDTYHQVFDLFGFGMDNRALLLFYIYPFEKFLVNNQPWIEWEESRGKRQKRDRSLRKFQAFLGMTYKIKQSGNRTTKSFGGSSMVRAHLYCWAVCQIAPNKRGYKVNTPVGRELTDRYVKLRQENKITGKDALIRILFKATRMLFYELVKVVC